MTFEEKHVVLKNGVDCILRSPGSEDAEEVLAHLKQTSVETDFMIRYPEEIKLSVSEEEKFLESYQTSLKNIMISAFVDGKIVANASCGCVMDVLKYRHRAELGISVQMKYWNLGIGTILVSELIGWAEKAGYEQLELEAACGNERAVRLYRKLGFEIYGTRERSFELKDGTYLSAYLMLLPLRLAR